MALAHTLGFSRIGRSAELKQAQIDAGIDLLSVGGYAPAPIVDQPFAVDWEPLLEEAEQARALGHAVKAVITGPLTYLWQLEAHDADFDKLELVDDLLPQYGQAFQRLAAVGVEWVQIDEPILALDLPQAWKNAYERVYNLIQREPLKKLVATYFGGLQGNLGLAVNLPVDGLHVDLVDAPEQYPTVLDRLPAYKVLSLGVVDGRNAGNFDLVNTLELLRHAAERLGDRLWVASSCPVDLSQGELPLAVQKCQAIGELCKAINQLAGVELAA